MKWLNIVNGVIMGAYAGPQDPEYFPGIIEVEDDDPRWLDYINPPVNIVAVNTAAQVELATAASIAMTPLFMALQLGDATDDETLKAKAWQAYYRALKLVDITVPDPAWPTLPE